MPPRFRCVPIPTSTAERFRRTGRDDRGNAVLRRRVDGPGFPCRHCLRMGVAGETMLLGSYDLPRPRGIYWTPSPIFVHAHACERFAATGAIAPIALDAGTVVSVRSYDAEEMCLYDLGRVCTGPEVAEPLARVLADPRAQTINLHTARPGCFLLTVQRIRSGGFELL